jgi:hypothetical protein
MQASLAAYLDSRSEAKSKELQMQLDKQTAELKMQQERHSLEVEERRLAIELQRAQLAQAAHLREMYARMAPVPDAPDAPAPVPDAPDAASPPPVHDARTPPAAARAGCPRCSIAAARAGRPGAPLRGVNVANARLSLLNISTPSFASQNHEPDAV